MKRACSIAGWTLAALVLTYALNELLLDLLLSVLGITKPRGSMLNALPHAVGLVLRVLAVLVEIAVAISIIALGSKGRLPGTHASTSNSPHDPS